MDVNQYVFVRGARQTRGTLALWNEEPWPVLRSWIFGGAAVAIALLCVVWIISSVAQPDPTPLSIPGVTEASGAASVLQILFGNSLVLALHAFAWVVAVTCFSLATQAYALGWTGATLAYQLQIPTGMLILTVLPHALSELTALFLPLAAWTIASRKGEWGNLLAATVATVAVAIPTLVIAALWETYVWPQMLEAVSPVA